MNLKHSALRLSVLAALCALSAPALAIDCSKAQTPSEKLICSSKSLQKADSRLNKTYAATLKAALDEETRAMLVTSQKRWIAARDKSLEGIIEEPDSASDGKSAVQIADSMIAERTAQLEEKGRRSLIEVARTQRAFLNQFSGGDYAGYETSCDMLPPDQAYNCFPTRHYQNGDRVCSVEEYWATNTGYMKRFIANIIDGKPKLIASCSFNGDDNTCPTTSGEEQSWNVKPKPQPTLYSSTPELKLDGEVNDSDDYDWLKTCLTDKSFPVADPTRSGVAE
ncbi:lysozyme inhibitor LprI family protein [Brucella pituitosa]|uniref:lysozyme inhibitor LprI family protein n=1 Tax=Brucella pituitosa TaxID=571256 RepID=UPI003F4ADC0F